MTLTARLRRWLSPACAVPRPPVVFVRVPPAPRAVVNPNIRRALAAAARKEK